MKLRHKIGADTVVAQTFGVVAADMDGECVMMSVKNGKYYSLDPIGNRIWKLIERPLAVHELITVLLTEYHVEEEQCRRDVFIFLDKMIEDGMVAIA